jgi:hypothetical protein
MDTLSAFAMGAANRGKPLKVFDWNKAAKILRERGVKDADAGLEGDYDYTRGSILKNGKPVAAEDTYTYLASTWATPTLIIGEDEIPCWRYRNKKQPNPERPNDPAPTEEDENDWNASTYWPKSARAIFNGVDDV